MPFPFPVDLPGPEIQPASTALAGRFFTTALSGKPDPWKEEKKSAPTLPEQSQEPHLVNSECHTLSWGGAPGGQEHTELSSPRSTSGSHLKKTNDTSRKPCPHKDIKNCSHRAGWEGKRSRQIRTEPQGGPQMRRRDRDSEVLPGETSAHHALGTTALGQPQELATPQLLWTQGDQQEAWKPDSSLETCTCFCSWNRLRGRQDTAQDLAGLLGSPCALWPTNAPSAPLEPVHSP